MNWSTEQQMIIAQLIGHAFYEGAYDVEEIFRIIVDGLTDLGFNADAIKVATYGR